MSGRTFGGGRDAWLERLGMLRNVVRQELVTRQLDRHLPTGAATVLDVGAGQGTQAIRLAERGHRVLALEPDGEMRDAMVAARAELTGDVAARLNIADGSLGALVSQVDGRRFDVVCCHGVLMYLDDPAPAIVELAAVVAPGGMLSLVARNAEGMALRPGLRRDWMGVQAMLDAAATDQRYLNEIGVPARADRRQVLTALLGDAGLGVEEWYGVRLLVDGADPSTPPPDDPGELAALLDAEDRICRTDPYRQVATMLHVVAREPST